MRVCECVCVCVRVCAAQEVRVLEGHVSVYSATNILGSACEKLLCVHIRSRVGTKWNVQVEVLAPCSLPCVYYPPHASLPPTCSSPMSLLLSRRSMRDRALMYSPRASCVKATWPPSNNLTTSSALLPWFNCFRCSTCSMCVAGVQFTSLEVACKLCPENYAVVTILAALGPLASCWKRKSASQASTQPGIPCQYSAEHERVVPAKMCS